MKTCEWCGKKFNPEEEAELFDYAFKYDFRNFKKNLCAECAEEAIDEREEDVYFEDCECCGKKFDLIAVEKQIDEHYGDDAYWMLDNFLCLDCAENKVEEMDYESEKEDSF